MSKEQVLKLPILKPGIKIYKENDNRVHFIFSTKSYHQVFEVTPPVLKLLVLINYGLTYENLYQEILKAFPNFNYTDYEDAMDTLLVENIIEDYEDQSKTSFNNQEKERYNRLVNFWTDFSNENTSSSWKIQENIKRSKIVILGAGGTGSWIAQSLAMAGVGTIDIVDCDTIELHNLTRQSLYFTRDIGKLKTQVLKNRIQSINPYIKVNTIHLELKEHSPLTQIFNGSDLIINCTDYPDINTTSEWVSKACMNLNIPHIVGGGYNGHVGMIGPTIIPFKTACWKCFSIDHHEQALQDNHLTYIAGEHKFSGAMGALSAIVSNIQTWEALRIIGGIGKPLCANKKGELYFDELNIQWTEVEPKIDCNWCRNLEGVT